MTPLGFVTWYPATGGGAPCDYIEDDARCGAPAAWVRKWQTQTMPAPAFWYFCAEHANQPKLHHVEGVDSRPQVC